MHQYDNLMITCGCFNAYAEYLPLIMAGFVQISITFKLLGDVVLMAVTPNAQKHATPEILWLPTRAEILSHEHAHKYCKASEDHYTS
jgi:hypothetical protein